MIKSLLSQHCGDSHSMRVLDQSDIQDFLKELPNWVETNHTLQVTYHFDDYYQTIDFVNALAYIANRENHHPDLSVHYSRVVVSFSTHDAQGLTMNDFICAAKCQALFEGKA